MRNTAPDRQEPPLPGPRRIEAKTARGGEILFAWTVGLTVRAIVRLLGSGVFVIMDVGFAQTLVWLAASTVLVWMTAGVLAVV